MDFSQIRTKVLKIEELTSDLVIMIANEKTKDASNIFLKNLLDLCVSIENKIGTIKNDIIDSEMEEEEALREEEEKEQQKCEEEYYSEG